MLIQFGNDQAITHYQDPDGPPGQMVYRVMDGQRITSISLPPDLSPDIALISCIEALSSHMLPGAVPVWIDGNPASLVKDLCRHYGITLKSNKKPLGWGAKFVQ